MSDMRLVLVTEKTHDHVIYIYSDRPTKDNMTTFNEEMTKFAIARHMPQLMDTRIDPLVRLSTAGMHGGMGLFTKWSPYFKSLHMVEGRTASRAVMHMVHTGEWVKFPPIFLDGMLDAASYSHSSGTTTSIQMTPTDMRFFVLGDDNVWNVVSVHPKGKYFGQRHVHHTCDDGNIMFFVTYITKDKKIECVLVTNGKSHVINTWDNIDMFKQIIKSKHFVAIPHKTDDHKFIIKLYIDEHVVTTTTECEILGGWVSK